jgi:hypothetical protein
MKGIAVSIQLTEEERHALEQQAAEAGLSVDELARRLISDHLEKTERRGRVSGAAETILDVHGDALDRLGR